MSPRLVSKSANTLALAQFRERLSKNPNRLLMLDYDGTLAPFQVDRMQAFPYPGVREILTRMMSSSNCRVVVISGRPEREVAQLLGVRPYPEIWGCHGFERVSIRGRRIIYTLKINVRRNLKNVEQQLSKTNLGERIEVKRGAVLVHFRGLPDKDVKRIQTQIEPLFRSYEIEGKLAFMKFDGGFELRATERNKGSVVKDLINEVDPSTPMAYLGDDETDEDAFIAIQEHGLAVLVRNEPRPTAAHIHLIPPVGLLDFLHECEHPPTKT